MKKIVAFLVVCLYIAGVSDAWGQIMNPTFADGSVNWNGILTSDLDGIDGYINAQKKGVTFDVWQEVTGLPEGIYSLEVQAFYQGSTAGQSYLYAKVGENEVSTAIMSIHADVYADSNLEDGAGYFHSGHTPIFPGSTADTWSDTGNGYIPTCQEGASAYFNEGHYTKNIVWIFVENGNATLRVGIKNGNSETNDWTCFDNFELTHYEVTSGSYYYLRNRSTNKFLTQGNAWGTQATLSDNVGIEFVVKNNGDKYVFDSQIKNVSHYLNGNGYVDSHATVFTWTQKNENYYALSENGENNFLVPGNGTTATFSGGPYDYPNQWELVTRQKLIDELKTSGATQYNPKDATILISASTFNGYDARNNLSWKGSPGIGGYTRNTGANHCGEIYNQNAGFDVYQELGGLPDGVYEIKAQAFYRDGVAKQEGSSVSNALLYASSGGNEVSVAVPTIYSQAGVNGQPTDLNKPSTGAAPAFQTNSGVIPNNQSGAAEAFAAGLYQTGPIKVTVTGGALRLGIKSNGYEQYDWTAFDNFRLTYLGLYSTFTGSGTYYLQNVATGEYLQGGSSYGTKAILGNGIEFDIQYNGSCHTLSSGIIDNGNNNLQYLCTEASLDHIATPFAIQTVSEGIYTIATTTSGCGNNTVVAETPGKLLTATGSGGTVTFMSGKNSSDTYSQWKLVTKEQRIAELNKATSSNPIDATFLIGDASFTSGDKKISNWKGSSFNVARDWGTHTDGTAGIVNTSSATDVYQELTGLPNGVYEVSMEGCHKNGNNAQFYANNGAVSLPVAGDDITDIASASAKTYADDTYKQTLRVTVSDGNLKIGVRSDVPSNTGDNLLIFDNFRLTYFGPVQLSVTNPYTGATGTYYLRNVATGEYLQGSGRDGLQTALGNGIEFELVKLADGLYNIRNVGISRDGGDYLCDEGWLNHKPVNFVITETSSGSGIYNIATQTDHCNNNAGYTTDGVANRLLTSSDVNELNSLSFLSWTQSAPGGTSSSLNDPNVAFSYKKNQPYASGTLVYGDVNVYYLNYTDLTGYTSMTIEGAPGSKLRVLLNRTEKNGTVADGKLTEIAFTIGETGTHTIDLSSYAYVHLHAIKVQNAGDATATIEQITLDKPAGLQDLTFGQWTQAAPGGTMSNSDIPFTNFQPGRAGDLVYGDGGVQPQNYANLTGYKYMTIKATPNTKLRLLFNRNGVNGNTDAEKGTFVEVILSIAADGYGILDLSKYEYVHLNAIKVPNGAPDITIESITLSGGPGKVSFKEGAVASDPKSQWGFVTEEERIRELAGATRANPKDATFLIKNASLTQIDSKENDPFWQIETDGNKTHWFYIRRDETVHTDGAGGVVLLGGSGTDATWCDIYQTITDLPNGLYEISMQGCYRHFDNAVFYANGITVALDQAGSEFDACVNGNHSNCTCRQKASVQTYGTNNYKKTLQVIVTNGQLRVGVKGTQTDLSKNFLIFDNFTLSYLGEVDMMTYYVRNVATGDFIRAGGHYEAQAIRDEWGMPLDFIKKGDVYAIDSKVSNGGTNQFLGTNGFLDSPETDFTLVDLGNNKYAIRTDDNKYLATSEADNYVNFDRGVTDAANDTHAQWELLTRDQLIEELKKSNASDSNPQDATFLIEGSNLNRHDLRNNATNWKGIDFSSNEYGGVESLDWGSSDNIANSVIEKFNKTFDTYQIISGLPEGVYELTVQGYYRSGNTATAASKTNDGTDILRPFLYVKQGGNLIGQAPLQSIFDGGVSNQTDGFSTSANGEWLPNSLSDAAKTFRDEYYMPSGEYNKVRFVVPSDDATVQIGVKKNVLYDSDWTAFDNFRLTYLGVTDESQTVYEHEIGTTFGTFYLKNAQTGTYLTAGGDDGVSAVLGDQMHQHSVYNNEEKYQKGVRETDFTFVAVGADKFVIETGIGEGYLTRDNGVRLNGKLESSKAILTLRKNDNGNYYISHGSDLFLRYSDNYGFGWGTSQSTTPGNNFQWIFQTKADLLAEFPSATEYNPIDATFLLRGTAFHKDDSRNSAWTGKPVVGGAESNYVGSASVRTYNISQTLTDLPAGVYEFTLQGYHTNENGINEQARYYVSTDTLQRTLITKNTSGATTFINAKNYAIPGDSEKKWELDFQNGSGGVPIPNANTDYNVTISEAIDNSIGKITINGTSITDYFGLQTGTNWLQRHTSKGVKGLYSSNSGPRNIGLRGLKAGQTVCIQTSNGTAFDAVDKTVLQKISETKDEVIFRVLQDQTDDVYSAISVQRYTYIYKVGVYNKKNPTSLDISDASTASSLFADATDNGVHPVIRFEVPNDERKMVTLGVFDAIKDADALYIDNVRLTYLGTSVTEDIATPQKLIRGIRHKRSRYYDLAAENGHLEFVDYNTVNEASNKNKTTLSYKTMVAHEHIAGRMIQHAPVYRDTIYARAGETLNIVLPSSYTDLAQSSGKYYQRLYNYKTDDMFVEDAANVGVFDLSNQGTAYSDADIRKKMEVYEGSMSAPAGGWVFGNRWGQQLVSKFNFTTPTSIKKFSTLDHAIEIAVDYTDLTDVGDMGMFGDLTEPTLVQRAIFVIVPSDEMVKKLRACTGDKFLEVKSISYPTIWHGLYKDDLNAVALDKQVRNYFTGVHNDVNPDSLVITLTNNGTGITFANGYRLDTLKQTSRFIKFKYPSTNEVTNCVTEYIEVKTKDGKNIAKFILDFVPDTELRPWKDIMGQDTLSRSPMYLDNHAELIDVLNFDKSYRKDGNVVTHPGTWPIGDATSINGIEGYTNLDHPSQFNPYPLNFDQTTFGAYYPRAIWSQYSVMKSMHSYRDKPEFKDVNQLYHDYFSTQEGTDDLLDKYQGGGYFMYIDASNFPSSIARLTMEEKLCAGTTIHFSGWVSSLDKTTNSDKNNSAGYLLFSIVGIEAEDGNETVIESFCPGPIRADAQPYVGEMVGAEGYHADMPNWDDSYSIWQQFAFSFVIKADVAGKYEEYALKIDNYCSSTSGGDMMVDDVRLYIHKAVPDVMQSVPVCSSGDMSGVEICTDFDQLLSAVSMQEATSEADAYQGYVDKQGGGKIVPTAWYCFLDKKKYDDGIAALTRHNIENYDAVFNSALVKTGGGTGYHSFTFSTCYESNDGGLDSYRHTYTNSEEASSTQVVTYAASKGNGTDKRIYFTPESIVSLDKLSYYHLSNGTWNKVKPVWSLEKDSAGIVYGDNSGDSVRYVDLSAYDELRIYQSDADVKANGPVRCFFFPKEGSGNSNFKVSKGNADGTVPDLVFERGDGYWVVDLEKVKNSTGRAKLITIKAGKPSGTSASVTAINVVRKSVELEPDKDYYIVFKAYQGETGVTSLGGPTTFFNMRSEDCAARDSFSLVSGIELRYDGELNSEGKKYCEGQIATVKMEIQAINTAAGVPVKEEDLFYDWWLGDINSFSTKVEGEPDSPQGVLFDFREAYPEATVYDGQPAKVVTLADGGYECNFTEADSAYLEELVNNGRFLLYQSSLNVRVENSEMAVSVMPIVNLLKKLTGLPYCKGPIEVKIPVQGKSPSAKHGFQGTRYPMDEVPVRIGLSQLKSATDESADKWIHDNTSSLYIPLRDIKFSDKSKYNSFGKKKHNWGTDSTNTLEIAAVYLAETNDPDMVSYGDDVDPAGHRELRYVGKVHVFQAALNEGKFENYVQLTFNPDFTNNVKEGYRYTLKTSFVESGTTTSSDGTTTTTITNTDCAGDLLIPLYIVPEYQVWVGGPDGNWANDDNWRRADNEELKFATTDRPTNEANTTSQGFVPMDFTNVLMQSNSVAKLDSVIEENDSVNFSDTYGHTPNIQYHLAAAKRKGENIDYTWIPSVVRGTDIYCEPFYTNTAKEVHFEPHSQMLNTQYLTYERAWVEYALESGRWYTLSSPLQGVVSGDMYLPRGTAKQETPYFNNITYDNTNYTRLAPAVYQQAWDKAEATTYRLERDELVNKRPSQLESNTATVNVARAFDWSREYNDVKVPFGINGFSVKVDVSRIEDYSKEEGVKDVLLRLPKDDKTYRYYMYDDDHNGSETVDLTTTVVNGKNLRENAGKLFTDGMPAAGMTVTLTNNSADNPYFLVGNPFMSGLDLDKFFAENTGLDKKYWILTKDSYSAGVKDGEEQWASTDEFTTGNVAPLQAFFVKKSDGTGGTLNVTFTSDMAVQLAGDTLQTRAGGAPATLRLTAMRDGVESRAIVVCREEATEGFSAGEDVEALFDSNLSHAPTLYTAAGEVAAAINVRRTLHGVPVGIGGEDESEVTLTFDGVEQFGEELYLYDAAEGTSTLIPASGTSLSVCGRTTGRYYLVTTPLDGSAQESVPVVSVQGHVVTVLSAFDEILSVEAYDATGRKVYAEGAVGNRTRFTLSAPGVYLITVKTAAGVFSHKVLVNS